MVSRKSYVVTLIVLMTSLVALGCGAGSDKKHEAESEKGPHGGRMLHGENGFALEVTIYEPGIPPQSRVYAYKNDVALSPDKIQLVMELHRFDRVDTIQYSRRGQFLYGDKVVQEPHSFDVKVRATYNGKQYAWEYDSYEGRTEISAASAELSGIGIDKAEARQLVERVPVLGHVGFDQDALRQVAVRYPGVVRSLRKGIGDTVKKGEVLGVVLGTQSLNGFSVLAPSAGRVIEKPVTVGEVMNGGDIMFVIADLSTVWVDFTVYRQDAVRVASGQVVRIVPGDGADELTGTLAYLAPVGDASSQSVMARAIVPNPDGNLRPGLFVKGEIVVGTIDAPVVVKHAAVQTFRDWQVVFRNRDTLYEIAIVELGVVDGDFVQVLSGMSVGVTYVAENSFIVKADVGKSGATHDH